MLGHSLNDSQIVDAIAERADPRSVAITVYGSADSPLLPEDEDDPVLGIQNDKLPEATIIPIRFGEEGAESLQNVDHWIKRFNEPLGSTGV